MPKKKKKKVIPSSYTKRMDRKRAEDKKTIVFTILMLPLIIAGTIATMILSYMFVPLMMVLIIGSIVFFTIKANKKLY